MQKFVDFENGLIAFLSDQHEWFASHFTQVFHTPWPYVFILVMSLMTMLLFKVERKGFWKLLMDFILVSFPVAILLMEVALLTLGRMGSVWWFDPYHMGLWDALLYLLIYMVFLSVQWIGGAAYFLGLKQETVDDDEEKWDSICFTPLFVTLVVFYPFASWVIYHVGSWIHLPGIVAIVLWLLIPIAALLFTWAANSGAFGFGRGLLFTIISICVAVGLLAGLCILLQALKILYWYAAAGLMVVLLLAIPIFILLAYNEKDGGKTSDGTKIILYWWENPGRIGAVLAVIISYLILHFWLKVL